MDINNGQLISCAVVPPAATTTTTIIMKKTPLGLCRVHSSNCISNDKPPLCQGDQSFWVGKNNCLASLTAPPQAFCKLTLEHDQLQKEVKHSIGCMKGCPALLFTCSYSPKWLCPNCSALIGLQVTSPRKKPFQVCKTQKSSLSWQCTQCIL